MKEDLDCTHKQNRYSLYRSLDSSIVLKYPDVQTE